jgi:hypothetical protein
VVSFTLAVRVPGTNLIRGSVGPSVGPDGVERRKISCPYRKSNSDFWAVQTIPAAIPTELSLLIYRVQSAF